MWTHGSSVLACKTSAVRSWPSWRPHWYFADADFLYGPKDESGADTYVLCEIKVSAVWPFPPHATGAIVEAAVARIRANS